MTITPQGQGDCTVSTETLTDTTDATPADETPKPESDPQRISNEQAEQIAKARQRVKEAQAAEEEAKAEHAAAKKHREALDEQLGDLLDDILNGQRSLFDETVTADEGDWRAMSVGELDLPQSLLDRLCDLDLGTLGALSDRMATGDHWADDLDGIGIAKAEKIAEAFAFFWQEHPEYCQADTPAAEAAEGEQP